MATWSTHRATVTSNTRPRKLLSNCWTPLKLMRAAPPRVTSPPDPRNVSWQFGVTPPISLSVLRLLPRALEVDEQGYVPWLQSTISVLSSPWQRISTRSTAEAGTLNDGVPGPGRVL